jgi:hypothetical protein
MMKFQTEALISPTATFHRRSSENPEAKPAFSNRTCGSKGGSQLNTRVRKAEVPGDTPGKATPMQLDAYPGRPTQCPSACALPSNLT